MCKIVSPYCGQLMYAVIFASLFTFSVAVHHHKHKKDHMQGDLVKHPLAFSSCREHTCASRVSACLLMEECDCLVETCECCADCMRCLGSLWKDCCDCVGLCMPANQPAATLEMSTVGDLKEAIPSLFKALSYGSSLPVVYKDRPFGPAQRNSSSVSNSGVAGAGATCQVAFYNDCMPLDDCVFSCRTMGAHRYRWFHNGCCQCVGEGCPDYGEGNPQCSQCLD